MKTEYWPQGGEWIASESLTQYAWGNTEKEAIEKLMNESGKPNNRPEDGRVCDCEDAPCCGHYE